jgi:hypothetical protein
VVSPRKLSDNCFLFSSAAELRDNFGNKYKSVDPLSLVPKGGVYESETLYPKKPVRDILVFEVPLDTIEYLQLQLPADNVGMSGSLRFRIPKSMIRRQ